MRLQLFLHALLLTGCAGNRQGSTCVASTTSALDPSQIKQTVVGGYLESERYASENDAITEVSSRTTIKSRCSALLVPLSEGEYAFELVTARHCVSLHLQKTYSFFLSHAGVFYEFKVESADVERMEKARGAIREIPDQEAQRAVLRAFGGKMDIDIAQFIDMMTLV